jgi:predicted HTH domain antitoxin
VVIKLDIWYNTVGGDIMRSIPLSVEMPEMVSITEKELKVLLATKLYEMELLSLGQAAKVAGLSKRAFIEIMGQYGVSLFSMSTDELQQDLANA